MPILRAIIVNFPLTIGAGTAYRSGQDSRKNRKGWAMDEQELEAALSLLMKQIESGGADTEEIYLKLTQVLNGMSAFGMPLPDDLLRLKTELEEEIAAELGKAPRKT